MRGIAGIAAPPTQRRRRRGEDDEDAVDEALEGDRGDRGSPRYVDEEDLVHVEDGQAVRTENDARVRGRGSR